MTQEIKPVRITKPIQLLGAWLTGLLAIDSCFLIAAANAPVGSWESKALTIAAILNVPLFLSAVFLLQTRFRPELQEDAYYSTYIDQKTNATVQIDKTQAALAIIEKKIERLDVVPREKESVTQIAEGRMDLAGYSVGVNHHLKDAKTILQALTKAGAVDIRDFGSDEAPRKRSVAVSSDLSPRERNMILRFAMTLGFEQFSHIEPFEEIEEQVLFGAYGDAKNILFPPEA